MNEFIGMKTSLAVEKLQADGRNVKLVDYNDRRMKDYDTSLVLRIKDCGGEVEIISSNFLFHPLKGEC